ncbi:hypothetical protein ACHAWF_018609 [Thalassiosira exigua]
MAAAIVDPPDEAAAPTAAAAGRPTMRRESSERRRRRTRRRATGPSATRAASLAWVCATSASGWAPPPAPIGRGRRPSRRSRRAATAEERPAEEEPRVAESRGDFDASSFAASGCWGRRPLLVRGAFDPSSLLDDSDGGGEGEEAPPWPSWEDVVDVATDEDSESRIVSHVPGDPSSFELRWGPLDGDDVDDWLAKASGADEGSDEGGNERDDGRRETLVINDVDRYHPPLADWIHETFSFLPNWRMDDGQISLAEAGGGIGPHVDSYDVFLIQMSGRRRWEVGTKTIDAREERERTLEGPDVRILDGWDAEDGGAVESFESHVLDPGDVLYLPPRVPHCGTAATGKCATLSVGCRAPSAAELTSKLAEALSPSIEEHAVGRYEDPDLLDGAAGATDPGELTAEAKERARTLLLDSLTSMVRDDERWDEFFGRCVTEPKRVRSGYPAPLDERDDGDEDGEGRDDATSIVRDVLNGEGALYRAEGVAFAHSRVNSGARFYANGERWSTTRDAVAELYRTVCNNRRLRRETLLGPSGDVRDAASPSSELAPEAVSFLEELVAAGLLYDVEE